MQTTPLSPGWRRALLALLALWAAILWLHRGTGLAMVEIWNRSDTFAHAWVVPPMTLWMIWRLRNQVLALDPRPALWVLLPMAAAGLLWLMGELVAVNTAPQFALVALLVLAVPATLGLAVTRVLLFPLAFLFFAVPAGDFLTPILMQWTADVTVSALRLTGIPVYREGLLFVIPSGTWSVVEACSGMRYLIASFMVGTLFAYLNYTSTRRRIIFALISLGVPILANWLRAYMIVMLGHLSGNQIAVGADHLVYGWVLFGIIIMLLYWIGARWAEPSPEFPVTAPAQGAWPLATGAAAVVLMAAVVVAPLQVMRRIEAATPSTPVALKLPNALPGGWQQAADPSPAWQTGYANPSAEVRTGYQGESGPAVGVYIGYYRQQNDKRKLVSSGNQVALTEGGKWNDLHGGRRAIPGPAGATAVQETRLLQSDRLSGPGRQQVRVWQLYWIDGRLMTGSVAGKLQGATSRLMGRGDDSAVILLYADDSQPEAAEASLGRFVASGLPGLRTVLDSTRQQSRPE